jgi:7,8-dihydropterin-6-yl-methyl-4-(beta-D-ribofuranosyl)aminobenzene 5'-phosphate synthase
MMKLSVLVDNNTLIDRYFLAEPGVSFLIEDRGARVLFDTGYSDIFVQNAHRMGQDLRRLDWVALSHGHLDHTWGLGPLIRLYTEACIEALESGNPTVIGAPGVFGTKLLGDLGEIGSFVSEAKMEKVFPVLISAEPVWLTDRLVFLGRIPRRFDFEASAAIGQIMSDQGPVDDPLDDDTALAYVSDQGLVVIAGCAHAGICNTVEQARHVSGKDEVIDVIGGFHLQASGRDRLEATAAYLESLNLKALHACHCTDLDAKIFLAQSLPVREVGVGLQLSYGS